MIDLNPFDDLIVNEPRRPEPAVPGLNEAPLARLLAQFAQLTEGGAPRPQRRIAQAQLVSSDEPGFGKSHLIGQLFRKLHGRATLVYVRPFQNAQLPFQSLLAALVKELHFPDRQNGEAWQPEESTQLDAFACAVLAHLVADIGESQGDLSPEDLRRLRTDALEAFGSGREADPWGRWMRDTFAAHRPHYQAALGRRNVELSSSEWLQALFAYAFNYPQHDLRQTCLDWIAGRSLSSEDAAAVGLRGADTDEVRAEPAQLDDLCRQRLVDFCTLACFYRPVVFCFDQTEAYGHREASARSLGRVLATLVNEAPNQLTLITSNQAPWVQTIASRFEDADRDRIASPSLALEGLTRQQGEKLIRLRLDTFGGSNLAAGLLDDAWLGSIFTNAQERLGARRFLQKCKLRWEALRSRPAPAGVTIAQLYEERRRKLLADPKRLQCDPDALQWLVTDCARGLPELEVYEGKGRHFTVGWHTGRQRLLFGFEPGANWRRWEAIAREALERMEKNPPLKAVCFRGAEQAAIPGDGWKVRSAIEAAKASALHILVLSPDEFAALHAGHDLYGEALGGDVPPHSAPEVLAFLQQAFRPLWERINGPLEGGPPPPPSAPATLHSLARNVREIVSTEKFLSLDDLLARLGGRRLADEVLKACGLSSEIRVHSHPKMTVLHWQRAM